MDVLASTPRDHEEWIVAEITAAIVRLRQRMTGERLDLRRASTPSELKVGDLLRMPARGAT